MKEEEEILLIEDDDDRARIIISILRNNLTGKIRHIYDGAKAVEFLFSEESKFTKLILLDLILPSVDGLEILKRLKADPEKRNIPVMILVTSSQTQAYVSSLGLVPDGFVHKPGPLQNCA
jgi:two-component system, response regulator